MLTKACKVSNILKNTGVDCEVTMGATAMLAAVPKTFSFNTTNFADPLTWFKTAVNASQANRVYPIFGNSAPIRFITNNKEADVIATLDDGLQVFIRYGFLNRVFVTTSGGLCYAKALQSFLQSGYSILEFDKQGHMLARDNKDGTYGGLRCDFMFSPSPDLPDFRNPWKTNFQVSFDPQEYVGRGTIFAGAEDLLGVPGLIDSKFTKSVAATTTVLAVNLFEECSETDLIGLLGTGLENPDLYVVRDKADGTIVLITDVNIVDGHLELVGTFVTGHTYTVTGDESNVLFTNDIDGFDFNGAVDILVP